MGSLEFFYFFIFSLGLWLSYCIIVFVCFDAIVELHIMDETMFNDFFNGNWKWIIYVMKGLFD